MVTGIDVAVGMGTLDKSNSFLGREKVLPQYVNGLFCLCKVGAVVTCVEKRKLSELNPRGFVKYYP